jgi:formate-dependent nitrite reductase cytochrome c552 subunit
MIVTCSKCDTPLPELATTCYNCNCEVEQYQADEELLEPTMLEQEKALKDLTEESERQGLPF